MSTLDHSSHDRFYDYYSRESQSENTVMRFRSIRDCILRIRQRYQFSQCVLEVADIGCGAGTQSMMWAELGHHVHGLDVNERLLELAKERAARAGHCIDFRLGSAVELPWANDSMDLCLVPELLEHVAEWELCINEFARILRSGGVLFLTTTNKLCPVQQEFTLPLYSWYPSRIKHHVEHLATTTRPELANYAKYPAVNWFSFYSLRRFLAARGFYCLDRFDISDTSNKGILSRSVVYAVRAVPLFRTIAHFATPGTLILGIKDRIRNGVPPL
jgi:2-polyprenyl-3-methyl-5-hydroxy-6-metoxy-1,4-benzoquinol methylase